LPSHALELLADRTNKAAMIIGYNKIDTAKAALLEPTEEGCPAFFRLGVTQHHAKHFPVAICIYTDSQHDAPIANASVFSYFQVQSIHQDKGCHRRNIIDPGAPKRK